jgi:membrane protease YdiL (CAAX protease family)
VQNLLERRLGRRLALVIASVIFGLSHFNKRFSANMPHFNWPYVLLATIAGIFYGRAWRQNRRVPASTITHASVDWLWGLWF